MALIPSELFDLHVDRPALVIGPTCTCFHAVDFGLPSPVARALLKLMEELGFLTSVDFKEIIANERTWVRGVIDEYELALLNRFPSALKVYLPGDGKLDREACLEVLRPQLVDLVLLLSIFDNALYRRGLRLCWVFHAVVQAFRNGLPADPTNPIAARALGPTLGAVVNSYATYMRSTEPGFEWLAAGASTQLRVLYDLALKVADRGPIKRERLHEMDWCERRAIVNRLSSVLIDGIEVPPGRRGSLMTALVGDGTYGPRDDGNDLLDGLDDWFTWLVRRWSAEQQRHPDQAKVFRNAAQEALVERIKEPTESDVCQLRLDPVEELRVRLRRLHKHQPGRPPPPEL